MLLDTWKLPCPMPLLPSEIKAKEEAEVKAAVKLAKKSAKEALKPESLKSIKARVLASFGCATTAEFKAILVRCGIKLNLTRRDSWEEFIDYSSGKRWLVSREVEYMAEQSKRAESLARIDAKKAENHTLYKYVRLADRRTA
jgi:lipopolysaccharide assembly outer membrane protein LptD (OstA)